MECDPFGPPFFSSGTGSMDISLSCARLKSGFESCTARNSITSCRAVSVSLQDDTSTTKMKAQPLELNATHQTEWCEGGGRGERNMAATQLTSKKLI